MNDDNGQGSLLKFFDSEDIKAIETLKSGVEEITRLQGETTNLLGQAANITGNLASIASSAAAIRQSDNNVLLMSQKIAAKKEMFKDFLNSTFSGRDKAIDAFIGQIENGAKSNNIELILKAMDGLTTIVASSPWPDFDSFKKLIDSGGEIELF